MSNIEKPKLNTLEPEPTPEEFKEIVELTKELEKKIIDIKETIAKHESDDSLLVSLDELEKSHGGLVDQYGNSATEESAPVKIIESSETEPVPSDQKLVDQYENVIPPDENPPVRILDAFGQPIETEKPAERTIETTETPVEEIAAAPAEEIPVAETVPEITQPEVAEVQEKTEAELVAQRIKKANETGEELSAEDKEYRKAHWPEVEVALINLNKSKAPEAAPAEPAATNTPTPDSKNEPAAKVETNPSATAAAAGPEAKTAKPESAPKARIDKAQAEQDKKTEKALENKDEKTKKRTKRVIEKAKAKGKKEEERYHWIYYVGMVPAAPTAAGVWLGNKAADAINDTISLLKKKFEEGMNGKKKTEEKKGDKAGKEKLDDKKSKREKLREKFGTKEKREPTEEELNALEEKEAKEEALAAKKKEFLEKAFNGKLEGENLAQWEKTSKVSIGTFFDPSRMGKTINDYKPWQKVLFEKLEPIYKKEPADKTSEDTTLGDFVTKLIEKDKLKDIWNPPSEASS